MSARWFLWAELDPDGTARRFGHGVPVEGEPPVEAERSGDGLWATLWERRDGRLVAVRVWTRAT